MARSSYIYIVTTGEPDSTTLGAFTVKYECVSFLARRTSLHDVWVERVRDGYSTGPGESIPAEEFLK